MQSTATRDLIVGVFVLTGLLAVAYLSIQVGGLSYKGPGGLRLVATFDDVGGLNTRAPAMISGVKVGQVAAIALDETLRARVVLDLDANIDIPVDSTASIRTAGLLGDHFVSIEPGAEDAGLATGEEFEFTDSALNLEDLIGTLVHNVDLGDSK